ncbi:hypothetical protein CERSUDRAFT_75233 [Gelatoporia subvermispora B]|uniref:DUF6533 domain-containing protein n=1 Tax=Ceriporiopsis subvermispora (strain B) TaxID=914234 RepID=M2PHW3_CERS8|nr:hypothetical protein CERSUDRAFT_75233 [Gelatoporia subvermispora B]
MADDTQTSQDIQIVRLAQVSLICYFSATTFYCYDYFLTLDDEVEYIWQKKFSFPTFIFYVVRYLALLDTLFVIAEAYPWPGQTDLSCVILGWMESAIYVALPLAAAGLTFLLGVVNPVVLIYCLLTESFGVSSPIPLTCGANITINATVWESRTPAGVIGTRASSVLSDGLVLLLTWMKTYPVNSFRGSGMLHNNSVSHVLFRDDCVQIALVGECGWHSVCTPRLVRPNCAAVCGNVSARFSSLLISRMMLHLRRAVDPDATTQSQTLDLASIQFIHNNSEDGTPEAPI